VQDFIEKRIKIEGGTKDEDAFSKIAETTLDASIRNMANAVLEIHKFFKNNMDIKPEKLLPFMANKVLIIYVATEDLDDAFRLFTILNDRGIQLRNSDILKSTNLGALGSELDKRRYAKLWEEAEGDLADDFDRFLSHIRAILVKEKARLSLLQEFEDKIYNPKEIDKTTRQPKPILLKKGKETFVLIEKYLDHYKKLLRGKNYDEVGNSWEFDNLITVMLEGLPATDWVPPLLKYFDRFEFTGLMEFLHKLDNKFSADWIGQMTPSDRIDAMNDVIKTIDEVKSGDEVIDSGSLKFNAESLLRVLDGPVYEKRFTKYIMLKLDYFYQNHTQKMHFETLSVEHILPQNPEEGSNWMKDFTSEERKQLTDKLGNLVLITRIKNSSQGRKDFQKKVENYFRKNIDTCPNSLRVLNTYRQWTPNELKENHKIVTAKIREKYGING
jgi:hypothetical protein